MRICGLRQIERVERGWLFTSNQDIPHYDRMTQIILNGLPTEDLIFRAGEPRPLKTLDLVNDSDKTPRQVLEHANRDWGLALADEEMDYLVKSFTDSSRKNPTDAELFMFAQVNSEHCRHKIFRASWTIDSKEKEWALFDMIRNTFKKHPEFILSAYSDNAAVLEGFKGTLFQPKVDQDHRYATTTEEIHTLIKVETHNHPTAVSPFPGAATGSGGEIRDEGICFTISNGFGK